jgi:hypothetical protein
MVMVRHLAEQARRVDRVIQLVQLVRLVQLDRVGRAAALAYREIPRPLLGAERMHPELRLEHPARLESPQELQPVQFVRA